MRVIVLHNRYDDKAPSGENIVVDDEVALLRAAGVEVETLLYRSEDIDLSSTWRKASLAVRPTYSRHAVNQLHDLISSRRPDLIHVHNLYPLISPAVISLARRFGIPVVQSVHNYRHVCANGSYFRDGQACTDCVGRRIGWPGVLHACYRDSTVQSVVLVSAMAAHRSTWHLVDRFFVLHQFAAEHMRSLGIPGDRIRLKTNMVPDFGPPGLPGHGFVFAARLDVSKGVFLLLDAWAASGLGEQTTLSIVGGGPLSGSVEERSRRLAGVRFLGRLSRPEVLRLMERSWTVVVPSLWFEGSPLTITEGASRGRPAIVTRVGGLPDLVDDATGWLASPDVEGLATTLVLADATPTARRLEMAAACRARFLRTSSAEAVSDRLLHLYKEVLEDRALDYKFH